MEMTNREKALIMLSLMVALPTMYPEGASGMAELLSEELSDEMAEFVASQLPKKIPGRMMAQALVDVFNADVVKKFKVIKQ